ncbi:MAG: glycosyltransferase, partial [Actinomycetes bacterium]
DQGPTKDLAAARIAPVSLLDVLDIYSRDEARRAIGLPTEGRIALVSLGSGAVGLDADLREAACAHVLDQGWQVATTQAILEGSMSAANGVHVLQRIYPLAQYIKAFDLVVSAAGYNAVHEFVPAGIPSVFVPNIHTSTDDQVARAQGCHDAGLAEWSHPDEGIAGLTAAIAQAISNSAEISRTIQRRISDGQGSQEAAALLLKLAASFDTDRPSLPTQIKRNQFLWQQDAKRLLRSMISTKVIPSRRQITEPADLLEVNLEISLESMPSGGVAESTAAGISPATDGQLTLRQTSELTTDLVQSSDPFEHISPNTSLAYWKERTAILHRFYRIKSTSMSTRK